MSRKVFCEKLHSEEEGLSSPPYPGELGGRVYQSISEKAWQMWLQHQTMLLNEYRLTPIKPKDRAFLEAEMEKFFFGDGSRPPGEFISPEQSPPDKIHEE